MIRLAGARCAQEISPDRLGVFAIKQSGQLNIYGQTPGVYELWIVQRQPDQPIRAAISRFCGVLTVSALPNLKDNEIAELASFLRQIGGDRLEGEESLLLRLGVAGDGLLPFLDGQIMRLPKRSDGLSTLLHGEVRKADTLEPVYRLLCKANASFESQTQYDAWLADYSHRCRHRFSECYILIKDKSIISTASISFIQKDAALVGGVATDPAWRGRGAASTLLRYLEGQAQKRNLTLWLLAASDPLADFYHRLGWEQVSRWTSRSLAPV